MRSFRTLSIRFIEFYALIFFSTFSIFDFCVISFFVIYDEFFLQIVVETASDSNEYNSVEFAQTPIIDLQLDTGEGFNGEFSENF